MAKETMTENEAIEGLNFIKAKLFNGIFRDRLNCIDKAVETLKEVKQYRAIGTPEECRAAVEKQTETLTVDEAKTIAAKAICIGCGYLAGCKCNYNGGNCMVSKPMLESVSKSFDDWNRRANDGTTDR